jgi:protoheme IX farnesyltransferase
MKENNIIKNLSAIADLMKYRLSLAVVLSSVTGYFLFSTALDHHLFILISGVFLLSSGSAALNQYTEREADSIMERTRNRPVPSKMISEKRAVWISVMLLISGGILLYFNGLIPFFLGFFNVLLYNLIYTRLKKTTILAIIPGALVGAIPPMIGFSSAGGPLIHQYNIAFSAFMFLWQLPHFWLIIIKYGKEYRAAGFATISKYLSDLQIKYLVFFWVLLSCAFLFLFFILTDALNRNMFLLLSFLNLFFIFFFYRLLFVKKEIREIKGAFILINSFSFLIMFILIAASVFIGI